MTTSYAATNQVAMNALPTSNGIVQKFLANATNAGAATFAPDGLAAAPIFGLGGQALQGNEIVVNGIATVVSYIGPLLNSGALCWVLLDCVGGTQQVAAAVQNQQAVNLGQLNVAKNFNFAKITASGNFTTPVNVTTSTVFKITLIGGGGGGGGASVANGVAGGGGAGAAATFYLSGLSASTAYAVVIGAAGGAGGGGASGGVGGTTQITIGGTVYSATGGSGGVGTTTSTGAQTTNVQGTLSASVTALPNTVHYQTSGVAGTTISNSYAGSNGGGLSFGTAGIGAYTGNGNGGVGNGYGVGGGGGVGGGAGGSGAPGLVNVEWIA